MGVDGAVFLALAHVVFFTDVVREETAACACTGTDEGALTSAEETAYKRAASGGATDDLGLGVVVGVGVVLLTLGAVVRLNLRAGADGGEGESGGRGESCALKEIHRWAFPEVPCGWACAGRLGPGIGFALFRCG